jgi:hypothetical protein
VGPKGCRKRDIGRVTAASDGDASDASHVMARIEGKPAPIEKDFEPSALIHWSRIRRHAYVAQKPIGEVLQGAKIAKRGSPRGDAGQGKKNIGARRSRGERLIVFGERENRGEDDGNHDRAKQSREIGIDVRDPDVRENRGHGRINCRQQRRDEPRREPGLQAAPLSGAASKPA